MALKPHRKAGDGTDISFYMNAIAERGGIVWFDTTTTGVGAALDDSNAVVGVPTGTDGGVPAGLLLNDVVNLDLTRQHLNHHQDEVQVNSKVTVATRGEYTTNRIKSGDTPKAGDPAHFDNSGELTTTATSTQVGRFMSGLDADSYCKVDINLP